MSSPVRGANAQPAPASLRLAALTRIPVAHFHHMDWAQRSIDESFTALDHALHGDDDWCRDWARELATSNRAESRACIFSAVCDAQAASTPAGGYRFGDLAAAVDAMERLIDREHRAARLRQKEYAVNDSELIELTDGLVRVVRLHDAETAEHLDAVGALSRRLATAMGLPDPVVLSIELGARLHDIGKVGIARGVLRKSGALDSAEWAEMRQHAEIGAAVLLDTPKLAHLAPIVRAHHERMDGTGYPDRLLGDEIPLESRVIAVADAFHAMTTTRPYRRAMLPAAALEVLADNAPAQFDIAVVEALFEMFRFARRAQRAIA